MFSITRIARNKMSAPVTRFLSKSLVNDAELENRSSLNAFVLKLQNGDYGTVEYVKNDNVYDLLHSNIPTHYRGLGYGHILAEKTFDYIVNKNMKMKITCEFLQDVYRENKSKYEKYYVP